MKITVKSAFIASLVLGAITSASAQTEEQVAEIVKNSDVKTLEELSSQFARDFDVKYLRALELAKLNNWPLEIRRENGGVAVLREVSEDGSLPLYTGTYNYGSSVTSRVNRIQPGGSAGLNLDGANMIAGVWEINRPLNTHKDFGTRVVGPLDGSSVAVDLHPTHVCGTIVGSGANSEGGKARGMAFAGKVYFADEKNDVSEMAAAAKDRGVLVSNHSYGLSLDNFSQDVDFYRKKFGSYTTRSKQMDDMLFAAPFYLPVKAAGNDRDGATLYNPSKNGHDLLTEYAVSKNVLVVAAVKEVLDYTSASSVEMSSFSSWGPTDDNRIKPDISDKGVAVYSTSNASTTSYAYLDGTSMATPGVTGALMLIQQHYSNLNNKKFMRSATLRGLVAHCADEAGINDGPDSRFGWGLINAERMANVISVKSSKKSIVNESNLAEGVEYTTTVYATGSEPLIATLSWTDRSGVANDDVLDSTVPALVNDLDIKITKDAETYFPWKLGSGLDAAAEKGDNVVDNIEKVELKAPVAGMYTITVTRKGTLTGGSQDYSLIVSGVDQTLGLAENDFKEFNVWPNPAKDVLNIAVKTDVSEDAFVSIYDVLGKKVMEQKMNNGGDMVSGLINIGNLNSGIFLVKVIQGGKQSVRKIVKE